MGRWTWWITIRWPFLVAICSLLVHPVNAAFVNGVEHFDGTTKDLTTWEQYGATFTQNDALMIGGFGNYADYTTKAVTIGVGQRVTAEVTLAVPDPSQGSFEAALLLTTNSAGTTSDTFKDSRFFGAQIHFDTGPRQISSYLQSISGANSNYGFKTFGSGVPVSGGELVLSGARYSVTDVSVSASFPNGMLIFDDTYDTSFVPIPNTELNISLHRTSLGGFASTATFDNVTISNVPEPLCGALVLTGGLLWGRPRSRTSQERVPMK